MQKVVSVDDLAVIIKYRKMLISMNYGILNEYSFTCAVTLCSHMFYICNTRLR